MLKRKSIGGIPGINEPSIRRLIRRFILGDARRLKESIQPYWPKFNQWIMAHHLAGVFHAVLKNVSVPDSIIDQWQKFEMSVLIHNLRSLSAAIKLFTILDSVQIPAVAMRGLSLSHDIYPTAGIRPMRDVDILISPEQKADLLATMESAGITLHRQLRSQYVYLIDEIIFEIHWSLLTAKRYRLRFDSKAMLNTRVSMNTPDGRIYCLSNEDELVGLITHAFVHHELTILKQLVDIGLFISQKTINWDLFHNRVEQAGLLRMVTFTLGLVTHFFFLNQVMSGTPFSSQVRNPEKAYAAYIDPFFGRTGLGQYFRLKQNLISVAEDPFTKFRQLLRFITLSEMKDAYRRYL